MATKKTATSKKGTKYLRSPEGKWVHVESYRRTKPTRHGGSKDKAANFCSKTRKKKVMRVKRKK